MIKNFIIVINLLLLTALGAYALDKEDIVITDTIEAGGEKLFLNGIGFLKKFGIKVYACGLYVMKKTQDAKVIIEADEPMAIKISIFHQIRGIDWKRGWEDSFTKKTEYNISFIKDKIDQYISIFEDGANKKDLYDIIYLPKKGTSISKNSKVIRKIEGLEFKKVLFSTFLGQKAVNDLKNDLLNQIR